MSSSAYEVLGLDEYPRPSIKQVHDVYHALALEYHPDKNISNADEATAKFQAIQGAYTTILQESTLHDTDGTTDKTAEISKLVKPWAAKRGRKFNYREMLEVQNLKEGVAKAAAQRVILDEAVGE